MRTLEIEIKIPEVKGGRCVSTEIKDGRILAKFEINENEEAEKNGTSPIFESELERKIDPNIFEGAWLNHQPTTQEQKKLLEIYLCAKVKDRLHPFTCMTIDPTFKYGRPLYQKGMPIAKGFTQSKWAQMLKKYNPSRNSRQMTRTEYACKMLFLIKKLVESGFKIEDAWYVVCNDSREIAHCANSDNSTKGYYFEPTGSREVCGFCDLGNAWKLLAEDPWDNTGNFWIAGSYCGQLGQSHPVATMIRCGGDNHWIWDRCIGLLALD